MEDVASAAVVFAVVAEGVRHLAGMSVCAHIGRIPQKNCERAVIVENSSGNVLGGNNGSF